MAPTKETKVIGDDEWVFYVGGDHKWRWQHKDSRNGEVIGASTEGYTRRIDMIANAQRNGYPGSDE